MTPKSALLVGALVLIVLLALFAGPAAGAPILTVPSHGLWPLPSFPGQGTSTDYVPGEVLVTFVPGATADQIAAAKSAAESAVAKDLTPPNATKVGSSRFLLKSGSRSTAQLIATLSKNPIVVGISPNYRLYATDLPPNDPLFPQQWDLNNTGQTGGVAGADISALNAWTVSMGSADVVVADIDSGVDYSHPDLAANIWKNSGEIPSNGIDDDQDGYVDDVYGINAAAGTSDPMDDNGHGTHTAGTIAAVGDNGIGVTGVGWNTKVMALKFLDSSATGTDAAAIACINYAIYMKQHGVNVAAINASWGGSSADSSLQAAIDSAGQAGIIFCAAAGNSGVNIDRFGRVFYPASYTSSNLIAVAASDSSDHRASFSNYGTTSVDLFAPGVSIVSTYPNNQYASYSGTSMATPHVSGAVAVLAAVFPGDTVSQRIQRIFSSVDKISGFSTLVVTGGRLDLAKAVGYIGATTYSITATVTSAGGTGTATVDGSPVPSGGSSSVTITPAEGYVVGSVSDFYNGTSHDVTASVPASGGVYNITNVTSDHAVSVGFAPPPPTVTSLSPTSGPTSGGTQVTITGINLTGATAVTFGGTPATSITSNTATQIVATAPPGTGTVDVRVTTPVGTSAVVTGDKYTYADLPAAPTALGASALSTSSIRVTWTDNATNELGFFIMEWTGSSWNVLGSVGPNTTTYTVTGLSPNTIHVYIVGSYNSAGENWPAEICYAATNGTAPAKVTGLTADVLSSTSIKLTWTDNSANEWGFLLLRWNGTDFETLGTVDANVTTYTDTGLTPDHQYAYFVAAVNNTGGVWSDPVWPTTLP